MVAGKSQPSIMSTLLKRSGEQTRTEPRSDGAEVKQSSKAVAIVSRIVARKQEVDSASRGLGRSAEKEYSAQLSLCSAWLRLSLVVELKKKNPTELSQSQEIFSLVKKSFFSSKLWVQRGRGGKKFRFFWKKFIIFF